MFEGLEEMSFCGLRLEFLKECGETEVHIGRIGGIEVEEAVPGLDGLLGFLQAFGGFGELAMGFLKERVEGQEAKGITFKLFPVFPFLGQFQ